jgi:hypothetical protein
MASGRGRSTIGALREQFPNVEIRGQLRTEQGKVIDPESYLYLTKLLRAALEPTRVKIEWQGMRTDLQPDERFPRVIVSLNGFPEATTRIRGQGSVTISLGMLLTLHSAPRLMRGIEFRTQNETYELESLLRFEPPPEYIDEILSILAILNYSESTGWRAIPWSGEPAATMYVTGPQQVPVLPTITMPPRAVLNVARLTSWHEIAHWHMERLMADHGRAHFESLTEGDLREWLSQHESFDPDWTPEISRECSNALNDPETARFWIREICADQLGVSAALSVAGAHRDPRTRMHLYIDIAMYFFVTELFELYGGTDYSTHPPARLRRSVSTFLLWKKSRLPETTFLSMEWGVGFMVTFITRVILAEVAKRIEQEPDIVVKFSPPWLQGTDDS